ncbi:hypothetical protein F4804DRAFT_309880 [Jackrogersella minutella]|nr:hypothetical protein F4804DRAFT_309880 [Jackrogersella minutella]
MFEVPDAKRVRREDLKDSSSDDDATQDDQLESTLREKLHAQLSGLLDISSTPDEEAQKIQESQTRGANDDSIDDGDAKESGEEIFTFRLFQDEEPSRKVVLESQNGGAGKGSEGAFKVAKRPVSYYLAEEPPPEVTRQIRMAAVSADYLLQDAKKGRWGLEKPWKVTNITITTNKKATTPRDAVNNLSAGAEKQKKRPGKKRRIILRVREKAKKEQEDATKRHLIDKEQHLKEKKQRLNKQKKLKRRAKARDKKQGMKGDAISEQDSRNSSPAQESSD